MILEPYAFSEIFIQDIVKAAEQTPFSKVEQIRHQRRIENSQEKLLAIHYRHGVGELSVQIGETLSRELPRVYFSNLLELIEKNYGLGETRIVVFTDAPVLALDFVPPKEQGHLWVTSPKYSDGVLEISGVPDEDFALDLLAEVEVNRGGDPLNAILMLASADILCMSRSSFSYIAAIYNPDGVIFMPADFWHQPLPNWIKI
jgi:hypothetical protein